MARLRKPRIHAPKIPKGEAAQVTIGNQEKQIKLLIDRCEELRKESDINYQNAKALSDEVLKLKSQGEIKNDMLEDQRQQYAELDAAYTRLSGWQDAIREFLSGGTNPFTTSSTLGG